MKPLFLVLAKLTGLLHLYWTLALLLQMAMMYITIGSMQSVEIMKIILAVTGFLLYSALAIWLAWILIVRTDWLADKIGIPDSVPLDIPAPTHLLRVGVQLLGIYVSVQAFPDLLRDWIAIRQAAAHLNPLEILSSLLSPLVLLLLGLFLALRASRMVALISRRSAAADPS